VQRTTIEGIKLFSLALNIVPLTGKIIKNLKKNLLQNGMLHFVFWIGQLSEIELHKLEFT